MKKLISAILITQIYFGLLLPVSLVQNVQGQKRGQSKTMNPNVSGLEFRLSEGQEGAENRQVTPPAKTDNLSDGETSNLIKRLPPIKEEKDDKLDFKKRAGTLPAPKTGKIVPVKFPADEQRANPNVGDAKNPLEVLRYSPQGNVPFVSDLSVTFSQPMVAVTSQEEAAKSVPVTLSPDVKGKWRWLGTKTLIFDSETRFQQSTKYTAMIPAGTKSALGQSLQKGISWTFSTPTAKVVQSYPQNQTTTRDVPMFVAFDQNINAADVFNFIKVSSGGKLLKTRLLTPEEINANTTISYYAKQYPNRFVAFRALNSDGLNQNALPQASQISVSIDKGMPSAEGPLTTEKPHSFAFNTFGAFKFKRSWCSYQGSKNCSPSDEWYFEFSNSIDAAKFDVKKIKVEPEIPNLQIFPSGNYIYLQGFKKGRTTYKVTVDGTELKDSYGQNLETSIPAQTFTVGPAEKSFNSQGGEFITLDPNSKPTYSVFTVNHQSVKVKLYSVTPADFGQFRSYMRYRNYEEGKRPQPPGKLISEKVVSIKSVPDELTETRIDLSPALNGSEFGHVFAVIEPTFRRDKYDTGNIAFWSQITQIGLDAWFDNQELVAFATALKDGKPLANVDVTVNGKQLVKSQESRVESKSWWEYLTTWGISDEAISTDETVEVEPAASAQNVAKTNDSGIVKLGLQESSDNSGNGLMIAKRGKDSAILAENPSYWWNDSSSWFKRPQYDEIRWFVFDDRKMYRPKEEVAVKGYIRKVTAGKLGDVTGLGDNSTPLNYSVRDPRGNEVAKGTANLNAFGAFDFKFKTTDTMNLGNCQVYLTAVNSSFNHQFQVQEFRRPEFEVTSKNETEAPYFVGGNAMVSVEAKYFAGGGLPNAEVNWNVSATPTNYTPPNRDDFTFGKWFPWWRYGGDNYGQTTYQNFKGKTGADGKHLLKLDFISSNPARPYALTASSSVQDVNRQTWSSATTLLVHPADLYVGIRSNKNFVNRGEKFTIEMIASDIDGKSVKDRDINVKAVLKDWVYDNGWKETVVDEQTCTVKSTDKTVSCDFTAKQGGVYTISAEIMDDRERVNQSELTLWVSGGKTPPKREVEQEEANLIPNKKNYSANDEAEILVQSPFTPAEGVLTLSRNGIVKTERFTMNEASKVLKFKIDERWLPNINVQVDLVGASPRTDDKGDVDTKLPKRPAFASGTINLPISTATRELTVSAEPREKNLAPGSETKVDVSVKDSNGNGVANSEVAVVVVDESVLALTGYRIGNPLGTFYTTRSGEVNTYKSRSTILLSSPKDLKPQSEANELVKTDSMSAPGASGGVAQKSKSAPSPAKPAMAMRAMAEDKESAPEQPNTPINLRTNFNALAVFAPNVKTDASGKATVDVKLPDSLTRYRVMVVAVDNGKRFGSAESNITAKQPLMVRPSAPRFLNFGDKFELPVVIQNQTDKAITADVAVRVSNIELLNGGGQRVTIPANDRVEVRFPSAAMKVGTARFQIGVSAGTFADAAEIELPVYTPATSEAFATYGTLDDNSPIVQPVTTPGDVWSAFGGLEVTTSSTQLQELTDAFIYLTNYRFECSEQISSRMISIAAMRDVLKAFKSKDVPTEAELKARFAKDIAILKGRQRDDGGFGLWKRDERYKFPFVTLHVAHALALAKEKGYDVPQEMLDKVKPYLKNVEKYFDKDYKLYPQVRWTISAYALYVRDKTGDKDVVKAKALLKEATLQKIPFEALGWIYSVLAEDKNSAVELESIRKFLNNRVTETAGAANFVTDYQDGAWLIMASNRRADGVMLEALINHQPTSDLIPKIVRGLLANRTAGRWGNTQENVFILLALDKYFNTYEKITPNFVAQVWLGNAFAGEQSFKGRSTDFKQIDVPMSYLTEQGGTQNLILNKAGEGRLYYRIGMKYAPKNLKLEPADYGFAVMRKYEAVDNADDVKKNADGTWTVKSGARVRVRLTMVAQSRRYHVALVDNLPAGFEAINPALAVSEDIPTDNVSSDVETYGSQSYGRGWYWGGTWYEHQNLRDERAEVFSSLLWEGVWNYSYVCRATTPGTFVAPPAKAEEMYMPETFGRSGTDVVKVE